MWPVLAENIPELAEYTPREFFRAVNSAKRTPLRSEADEFSYCLHILIRFEIERGLMNGTLAVHDAPALWNELTAKYLRCEVNSDAEGMLQDPHWAAGQIGYFPTYALGSVAAAQLMAQLRAKADVDACLRRGDVKVINDFLRERIWRYGAQYAPGELMAKALDAPLDVQYYADHLSDKLAEVYGV